jgi:hypothetical protein
MPSKQLSDQNPLMAIHGEFEIAKGHTLSATQIDNLWRRWSKTKRLPAWLERVPGLTAQVARRLGLDGET